MISIDRGDGLEYVDEMDLEGPFYLEFENDNEKTKVTEYRLDGKVVHRSVAIHLKRALGIEGQMGRIGG